MVRLVITNIVDGSQHDVTDYIKSDGTMLLNDEMERGAFQRVLGDMTVELSNLNDRLLSLLGDRSAALELSVFDGGVCTWLGDVPLKNINLSRRDEWATIVAIAKTKGFWDRVGQIRKKRFNPEVDPNPFSDPSPTQDAEITVSDFLVAVSWRLNLWDSTRLYNAVNVDPMFAGRKLRYGPANQYDDPAMGSEGCFWDINDDTKMADVFTAMTKYYNAEFLINPAARSLTMQKRCAWNGRTINIDDTIETDQDIDVQVADDQMYDWLFSFGLTTVPGPQETYREPIYYSTLFPMVAPGTHEWIVIGFIDNVPICESAPLIITLPQPPDDGTGWNITLGIPQFPSEINQRGLYRKSWKDGLYHAEAEFDNSGVASYTDALNEDTLIELPARVAYTGGAVDLYYRYDEPSGQWLDPLTPDDFAKQDFPGANTILDVRTQLQFYDPSTYTLRPQNSYDNFSFFRRDMNPAVFASQYEDVFITKSRIKVRAKGTDFRLGDGIVSPRLRQFSPKANVNYDFIVRKVSIDYTAGKTALEILAA